MDKDNDLENHRSNLKITENVRKNLFPVNWSPGKKKTKTLQETKRQKIYA